MSSLAAQDEGDKLIVVERGDLVFCFNFHPVNSYTDYRIGCLQPGPYKVSGKETAVLTCEPSHDLRPAAFTMQHV